MTGATGLVGGRLAAALLARGRGVRALTRDPARSRLDPRIRVLGWNGVEAPPEALADAAAVVHLAGEPVFSGRLTEARKRRLRASRIDSTRALVAGLGALDAGRRPGVLVCASAVGYYGSRGDEELDEAAPPGEGFLAELCIDWENAALEADAHGLRSVSVRIGIVLAREGGALPKLVLPFRMGVGGRLGGGRQWFPWIHAHDLVSLILAALDDERYRGPVNGVAPTPVTNAELTRTLARQLQRPAVLPVPAFALRAALGELAIELLGSRRVLPRVALDRGFRFAYTKLGDALAAELSGTEAAERR